jgi:hypothetical protein
MFECRKSFSALLCSQCTETAQKSKNQHNGNTHPLNNFPFWPCFTQYFQILSFALLDDPVTGSIVDSMPLIRSSLPSVLHVIDNFLCEIRFMKNSFHLWNASKSVKMAQGEDDNHEGSRLSWSGSFLNRTRRKGFWLGTPATSFFVSECWKRPSRSRYWISSLMSSLIQMSSHAVVTDSLPIDSFVQVRPHLVMAKFMSDNFAPSLTTVREFLENSMVAHAINSSIAPSLCSFAANDLWCSKTLEWTKHTAHPPDLFALRFQMSSLSATSKSKIPWVDIIGGSVNQKRRKIFLGWKWHRWIHRGPHVPIVPWEQCNWSQACTKT